LGAFQAVAVEMQAPQRVVTQRVAINQPHNNQHNKQWPLHL